MTATKEQVGRQGFCCEHRVGMGNAASDRGTVPCINRSNSGFSSVLGNIGSESSAKGGRSHPKVPGVNDGSIRK